MNLISIVRKIFYYFNLESELEDHEVVHETILKGIVFRGTNLWILVFAIIIASVGLNMNSTAVIIGAMLISPLMGPINGMGYSIATYNIELFKKSVKNYTFAVVTSLVSSTIYFALSPISTVQSELLARTSPTIYDVLIALFGGLAGIVAISTKSKGNIIPGVAIATALMPPLCTAGYGLATGQFHFFLGAIYLFTINTVFIALASVAISQFLKFPIRTLVDTSKRKKINKWITFVILIVILPSIYFGYGLVLNEKFNENANKYISNISSFEGNYLLKSEINPNKKTITLIYGGINLTENQKNNIKEKASAFDLKNSTIEIDQGFAFQNLEIKVEDKSAEVLKLRNELNTMSIEFINNKNKLDSIELKKQVGQTILKEINVLYPQINACTYSESFIFNDTLPTANKYHLVVFTLKDSSLAPIDKEKINQWLVKRLEIEQLNVFYK